MTSYVWKAQACPKHECGQPAVMTTHHPGDCARCEKGTHGEPVADTPRCTFTEAVAECSGGHMLVETPSTGWLQDCPT